MALSLIVTLFGTNLFHYATFDASYSHVYSFFLFATFLYLSAEWHRALRRVLPCSLGWSRG